MSSEQRMELVKRIVNKTREGEIVWELESGRDGFVRYTAHYNGLTLESSKAPGGAHCLKISDEADVTEFKGRIGDLFAGGSCVYVFNLIEGLARQEKEKGRENLNVLKRFIRALD